MRASICVLAAAVLAASAGSAFAAPPRAAAPVHARAPVHGHAKAHEAAAGQTWTSGHCRLTIPRAWGDFHGGKADSRDHDFNVTLGRAGDPRSMVATVKAMRGRVLVDAPDMVLMQVDLRGRGARQYWSLTKPGPGCRATVTFSEPHQADAAKKIAQSLRKSR